MPLHVFAGEKKREPDQQEVDPSFPRVPNPANLP